jgi:hypothetical protein
MRPLILSMGLVWVEVCSLAQRPLRQAGGFFYLFVGVSPVYCCKNAYVVNLYFSLCRLKNKPCDDKIIGPIRAAANKLLLVF